MDTSPALQTPGMASTNGSGSSSVPTVILWITFVLSLGVLIYLFVESRSLANLVAERQNSKSQLVAELNSSNYADVEEKATSLQQAFGALSSLSATRKPKSDVFTELYQHFTKDVKIRNLALAADGSLTVDGATSSYRAVADFMTGLKAYSKISDLKLGAAAVNSEEGVADNQKITFSVSAKLDISKEKTAQDTSLSGTDVSSGSETTDTDDDESTDTETVTPAEAE